MQTLRHLLKSMGIYGQNKSPETKSSWPAQRMEATLCLHSRGYVMIFLSENDHLWKKVIFASVCFNAKNVCINAKCLVFCVPFFVGILHAILPHFTPFYPSLFCQLALPFFHTFASESFILENSRVFFFLEFRNLIIFSCFTFRRGRWESSFNSCQPSHGEDWVFGPKPIRIDSNS